MRMFLFSLLFVSALTACNKDESGGIPSLTLIRTFELDVPEPSGLSFTSGKTALYTVSDETGSFYKITFEGKLLSKVDCNGNDFEGITYNGTDKSIWIVEERRREILKFNLQGNKQGTFELDIPEYSANNGPEGITVNEKNGHLFFINEKNPALLIELDENLRKLNEYSLSFANDYSGIFYDSDIDKLWIISDESSTVTKCELNGKAIESFHLSINQAEGIVVDSKNKLLYALSDSLEKLYVFELK